MLLLFVAPSLAFAQQDQDNEPVIRFVRNPDPAPDFKLTALDGKPITLAALQGKVVLLNFWATWCGPCRAEIPDLVALQDRYDGRLQIIGLNVDDEEADIQQYVKETKINYPVAMTSNEVRRQFGGIPALPTSFVLDTEGRVVQKHVGLWNPAVYETEIRALLGMPIMAKVETFEDKGEVFLAHADRATELPGVDLSKLTPEQKKLVLHRFNADTCTCGCKFTLAQCRIWDSALRRQQSRHGKNRRRSFCELPPYPAIRCSLLRRAGTSENAFHSCASAATGTKIISAAEYPTKMRVNFA